MTFLELAQEVHNAEDAANILGVDLLAAEERVRVLKEAQAQALTAATAEVTAAHEAYLQAARGVKDLYAEMQRHMAESTFNAPARGEPAKDPHAGDISGAEMKALFLSGQKARRG